MLADMGPIFTKWSLNAGPFSRINHNVRVLTLQTPENCEKSYISRKKVPPKL